MSRLSFPSSEPLYEPPGVALAGGVSLSRFYGMTLSPVDVARVLVRARVPYVLAGAHAINVYSGKPRATQDVDVLTSSPAKALRAMLSAYPNLVAEELSAVVRLRDGDREVLDLIKVRSARLFSRVMRLVTTAEMDGVAVVIPSFEAALALKFFSMISMTRLAHDRMQDAVDFARAASSPRTVDESLLRQLGELVYDGGGEAILKLVTDARAGRRLDV